MDAAGLSANRRRRDANAKRPRSPGTRVLRRFASLARTGTPRGLGAALAIGLLWTAPAVAAERWTKVPTAPYGLNNKQDALAFVGRTGWYGNGTGRVYRSDDGGARWREIWRHPGTYVRALDFADFDARMRRLRAWSLRIH